MMTKSTRILVSVLIITVAGSAISYGLWRNKQAAVKENSTIKQTQTASTAQEKPVAPEKNPPGDIPDSQVFVKYSSPTGGYELQVPEGWGRVENGANVSFVDKLDGIQVSIDKIPGNSTVINLRNQQLDRLQKTGRAVRNIHSKEMKLGKETVIFISYESNSTPDPVTGKQVRLENNAYLFTKNNRLAVLTLWAPLGADNVDQWNLIANSFRW